MKQNITAKQREEITGQTQEVLKEWCKKHNYLEGRPLLSIGQMIELVEDNHNKVLAPFPTANLPYWRVLFTLLIEQSNQKELCDALWQVVKEILEKENG